MKKMSAILSTLIISIFVQSAFAAKPTVVVSQLTNIVADSQLGANPIGGEVVYNSVRNTVSLTINFSGSRCPAGTMCTAYIQPSLQVELPVVSVTSGYCGAKIVTAEKNLMPVDGPAQRITVADNTINYCLTDEAMAAVTGDYTAEYVSRQTGEVITWKATFEGLPFTGYIK